MELFQALSNHAKVMPDAQALIDDQGGLSWGEVEDLVDRVALGLVHSGMRRGKAVAILAGRGRDQALSLLAAIRGGGVALPLPASLGGEALVQILAGSQPQTLIYEERYAALAQELCTGYQFRSTVLIGEVDSPQSQWEPLKRTDISGARFPVLRDDAMVLHNYCVDPLGTVRAGAGTLAQLWLATGVAIRGLKLKDGYRHLSLFSSGLQSHEVLFRAIRLGGTAVFCQDLRPERVMEVLEAQRVDVLSLPASYLHVFCDWVAGSGQQLPEVKVIEARGRLPFGLAARAKTVLGQEVLSTIGLPESFGPVFGATPTGFGAPAGPLQAYSGFQDRIMSQTGTEIMDAEVGHLQVSGDALTETVVLAGIGEQSTERDEGWLPTGLLARRSEQGELSVIGTEFDVVLRQNSRVYPHATAQVIEHLEGVLEAVGVLIEESSGTFLLVVAAVVSGGTELDPVRVNEQLSSRLSPEEMPDDVVTFDNLPRLADGSIDADRLKLLVRKKLGL